MISFILWLVGVICCIWCIKDVWTKNLDTVVKVAHLQNPVFAIK